MSTTSTIGIERDDGTIDSIYCHFDGYPEHNGKLLLRYWRTVESVNALINLGDLSSLGAEIGERQQFGDRPRFDRPTSATWCLAYGRDRGEDGTESRRHADRAKFIAESQSYAYLFTTDGWLYSHNNDDLSPLTDEVVGGAK